jgi:ABC-2 type transport system permease protein
MLESIIRILALTRKELLAVLKDPRSRFSLLVPPMVQCLVFGYAATYDLNDVSYAVLDNDHSAASRELIARLDGSGLFERVASLERASDIKKYIDERRALLVIRIDQDFERRLMAGEQAPVQVIADGRNSNTAGTATGYVATIVERFNADWRVAHPPMALPSHLGAGLASPSEQGDTGQSSLSSQGEATQLSPPSAGAAAPIQVNTRAWYNPNLETRWNMIPALIGTLTMLQTMVLTAMSVAREREQGTFDQLLVTPFRPAEIMAGKTLPAMLIGVVQATTVLLVAQLWFRIPFTGSYIVLYAGLTLFLLAAVGMGLLISAVAATLQQAMLYSFIVMMPFILLSGLTTPISSMPQFLQVVTYVNPLRYAIEIVHRVYLEGAGLDRLVPELWPLATIGLVTLSAASWLFRHGLE